MGVTESSFMCAIRPFFWVLPANTSISSVRLHTFLFTALSLKNVFNVVIVPHADEHDSRVRALNHESSILPGPLKKIVAQHTLDFLGFQYVQSKYKGSTIFSDFLLMLKGLCLLHSIKN